MGSSNENSAFGNVLNPWDHGAVPGGSSGGSSAAVAARLVPVATATDTGGSIREPAAFTGVTGTKPTYGRPSRWGMIAFASSLDTAGLMTRSAEDAALVFNHMLGFDPKDSTSVESAARGLHATSGYQHQGAEDRRSEGIFWRTATARRRSRGARGACRVSASGRNAGRHLAPERRARHSGVLRRRPGRSIEQPIALRWRALWAPRRSSTATLRT